MSGTEYTSDFYETIAAGCRSSAEVLAPLVLRDYDPMQRPTIIDVGCGQGWWGKAFQDLGCDVIGVDGSYVPDAQIAFIEHDLTEPIDRIDGLGRFDLVVCLEVAEHLDPELGPFFIDQLTSLGDTVLFSAAVPHQTGAGHVNLRWQSYWANLFSDRGYGVDVTLRTEVWNDDRIEPWYRQNLLLASKHITSIGGPVDVIHPIIHEWGR